GVKDSCNMGPHQSMIIPPSSVTLNHEGWRGRRRLVVKEIVPPAVSEWRPLVVMANPRSGGNDGVKVLSTFRKLLNPIQVVDLSETPPEAGLEICRLLPQHTCRLLVCGGDGTVGWVLSSLDKCQMTNSPEVAILPLGTGNDLARVLGWGKGYDDEDINDILKDVKHAQLSMLDRWEVKIEYKKLKRYLGLNKGTKELIMNNYLGVGCDAGVALNFHRQRESRPELFQSRFINKAWYLGFGAKDVLQQSCKNLPQKIEVFLDDVPQQLPGLEGVVVLNINSWSAGCSMWNQSASPSRMDDQLLEVVGLYSSLHVGKIQVSLGEPLRMGQAKQVKIVIHESVPVQVDGEPWLQVPATITVTHHQPGTHATENQILSQPIEITHTITCTIEI
ncbi:Diacylglycerol kinase epsilon, partial [Geodia barretti]